ncbi:MerR family DNA-binding transcriptional regulator [Paenibacillus sp. HJL G12]|uniref:MerR family DNA-binding transcriptional regulator n=1 Tax=Paenibacillus dendrobii TaxID=2691084 RepID=A0A7X3IFI8_9BACL|nr:TioE family transcriptional regulator [Paenibacillus dendrobii]MWV42957.1 MerR family DNA-binding transcriptional regulator [Paenibacillus dendrobii]
MEKYYKPSEIARELHISTSALRHYESWGIIPSPDRAANGYRLYTDVHFAYFRCVRSMFPGFGVRVTCDVLRSIQHNDADTAFWLVNKRQSELYQEKAAADQTLALLLQLELPSLPQQKLKNEMTIGEAAVFAGVTTSAIRHWEKEGLLRSKRDPNNGYRVFTPAEIRKILLIRTLRTTVYFLKSMKDIVMALDHQNIEQAKKLTEDAIRTIHERLRQQLLGVHQLVELCNLLDLI